jgi:hypothetical protein
VKSLYALAVVAALAGCESELSFSVRRAPGFAPSGSQVSVFGVFKDGQMSPKFWELLDPAIASALGTASCEAVFGERLEQADEALFGKIDRVAKDDGVTDELLGAIAPRAAGETIMVLYVFGKPPATEHPHARQAQTANTGMGRGGGGGRRGMTSAGGRGYQPRDPDEERAFEMSMLLFPRGGGAPLAELKMKCTGNSTDEAIKKFGEKLRLAFPGVTCAGWKWEGRP